MEFLKFLLSVAMGFLLSGIWFGLYFAIAILIQKTKTLYLSHFNSVFASVLPIVLIAITIGIYPIQASGLKDIKVYVIAILTVIITAYIIKFKKVKSKKGKDIFLWGLDGMLMEISQRLMMHSFIYGILKLFGVSSLNFYTIIATALVWCISIGMQAILSKKPFGRELLIDILASFVFSIGIGYTYQQTGLILVTMFAHFFERILSLFLTDKKIKIKLT